MRKFLRQFDWGLIISSCLLVGFGLIAIWSTSSGKGDFANFQKQIIFFAIGIILMFFFVFFDWRIFRENSYLILILYFFCLLALAGLFLAAPEIRGVKSWYKVGTISIDPIEFTKIILIILLAKYFSMRHTEMYRIRHIFLSGFYVFLPSLLIFLQPDLGSVLILIALWIGILMISGIKIKHFFILFLCGIIIFVFSWTFFMKDYQKERVMSFINPVDPLGVGWNQNQSKIAIGSGGVFGKGIGKGSQSQYGFLPEAQTDFIFAVIAEEMGLIGILAMLLTFSFLIWRIVKIAILAELNFPRFFAVGFAIILVAHIFIHAGMNLGVLPIIGISLPFVSYGGSSMVSLFVALGILQSLKS